MKYVTITTNDCLSTTLAVNRIASVKLDCSNICVYTFKNAYEIHPESMNFKFSSVKEATAVYNELINGLNN